MPKFKYAGTVSHGTLLNKDLAHAFLKILKELGTEDTAEYEEEVAWLDRNGGWHNIDATELVMALTETLERVAPEGYWFGAHPGDGSDFGFWPDEIAEG